MVGEQTSKKEIYLNQPTYYIIREFKDSDFTKIVSGAFKSKENALNECVKRNLVLETDIKNNYPPAVALGGKFKVIQVTCQIQEVK